jgi:ribosome recycling factor
MAISITLLENDIASLKKPLEIEMEKPIVHFSKELLKIRTGRAHVSLVDSIAVSVSGQAPKPLRAVATISAPEARLLVIQPWDISMIGDIEKVIKLSDLGVMPINDGKIIRITLPEMSSQRRTELVKILDKKLEEARVGVRNIRKDFHNIIRNAKKDKEISENFFSRLSDTLENVTAQFIKKVEEMAKKKEQEITAI